MNQHFKRWAAGLCLALLPSLALAQGAPVFQSGQLIAPHDLAKITRNGQIQDAGGLTGDANGRGVNPYSVLDNLGLGACSNSAATTGAYSALCWGHDSSGNGVIRLDSYGGAALGTLLFSVNGTALPTLPGSVNGMPFAADNAALMGLAYTYAAAVTRLDYAAGNGAPATVYRSSGSACPLNSGNGDNGLQVKSADNKCWIADLAGSGADLKIWGAKGNGVADDTTAINAALAAGVPLVCSPGTYKVSAVSILLNNASLVGSGSSCNFQATGTSGNIFTVGSGSGAIIDGINLSKFRITSAAARSGGAGIFAYVLENSNIVDLQLDGGNLYDGIELAQFASVRITGVRIDHCLHDGIRAYGGPIGGVQLLLDPSTFVTYCGHDGIVIGGGVGGLEADASVFGAGRYGIYFTNALAVGGPQINREIFMGPFFEVDTTAQVGAFIDTASVVLFISNGGWYSSTVSGPGVQIQDGNLGLFNFQGSQFFLNGTSGIVNNQHSGGTLMCGGCRITNNGSTLGGDGITLNTGGPAQNTLLSGNFINSNGILANGYGIRFTGSSGIVQVLGNYLVGNAQGALLPPTAGNYVLASSRVEQNAGYNPISTAPIAVGASPFTYTAGLSTETVYVGGGTLSSLLVNGQSAGTGTNVSYQLGPGDTLAIAYSVVPTMVVSKH